MRGVYSLVCPFWGGKHIFPSGSGIFFGLVLIATSQLSNRYNNGIGVLWAMARFSDLPYSLCVDFVLETKTRRLEIYKGITVLL